MSDATSDLLFASYGPVHAGILVLTVIGSIVIARVGRGHRGTDRAEAFSRVFGALLMAVTVGFMLLWLLPPYFTLEQSLPLHFSDVLRFTAGYALWSRRPLPAAVTYFWGLTLNVQSLITPDLTPTVLPLAEFASYWIQHVLVMWATVYLAWGLKVGPSWRTYRQAMLFTVVVAAVSAGANALLGTNYGYLNGPPESASALDLLGGWPTYLVVIAVLMVLVWALLTWPWTARRGGQRPPSSGVGTTRSEAGHLLP